MNLQFLAILPVLSVMMVLHELGHFITARRAGITGSASPGRQRRVDVRAGYFDLVASRLTTSLAMSLFWAFV